MLDDTLVPRERMPSRAWATPEEWQAAVPGASASCLMPPKERSIVRQRRRSNVSRTARQQPHPLQNTVMALPDTCILCLGRPCSGPHHASRMVQQELPPELEWFAALHVRVDLGYLGMKAEYHGEQLAIPTRKPRRSQQHPHPQWSEEQKAANTALRRVRIFIEQAIGGMTRSN